MHESPLVEEEWLDKYSNKNVECYGRREGFFWNSNGYQ